MDQAKLVLEKGRAVRVDYPADIAADYGRETYLDVYNRYKDIDADAIFVSKLEPAEEKGLHAGDPVELCGEPGEFEIVDLVEDEVSGLVEKISPGKIVIIRKKG